MASGEGENPPMSIKSITGTQGFMTEEGLVWELGEIFAEIISLLSQETLKPQFADILRICSFFHVFKTNSLLPSLEFYIMGLKASGLINFIILAAL